MAPKRKDPPTSAENSPSKRVTRSTAAAAHVSLPSTRSTRRTRITKPVVSPAEDDSSSRESEDELDLLPSKSRTGSKSPSPTKKRRGKRVQVLPSTPSRTRARSTKEKLPGTPRITKADSNGAHTVSRNTLIKKPRFVAVSQSPPPENPNMPSQLQTPSSSPPPSQSIVDLPVSSPKKSPENLPSIDLAHHLFAQKRAVLMALRNPPVVDEVEPVHEYEDEVPANEIAFNKINDLLHGTVARGEGNSCLLLGPRGSGKTHIIEKCISRLEKQAIIIRLSGWIQVNDRLAMREIAHQLGQQVSSSQLPEHLQGVEDATEDDENPFVDTDSMKISVPTAHLHTLISCIPTLGRPAIIILDAFDLFALHSRQSLLYSLLDTVQSCKASLGSKGLAVVGVTTRMDTIVLLEKRVKSRFSGRMIRTASPGRVQDWKNLMRTMLLPETPGQSSVVFKRTWKDKVETLLDDPKIDRMLEETFSITKDIRVLTRLLISPVVNLSPASPWLTVRHLEISIDSQRNRPQYPYLSELTYPALCLLIASVHADTAGYNALTFEMLHESVRDAIRTSTSAPVQINGGSIGMMRCSRTTLLSTFEQLVSTRIFVPIVALSSNIGKEFVKYRCTVEREDVKKAIEQSKQTNLVRWLTRSE